MKFRALTFFLLPLVLLPFSGHAQSNEQGDPNLEVILGFDPESTRSLWEVDFSGVIFDDPYDKAQCNKLMDALLTNLNSTLPNSINRFALKETADSVRLACEVARIQVTISVLRESAEQLRLGADELDRQFDLAHSIAPDKFPDRPGRDASQVSMRKAAEGNDRNIESLERDIARLSATRLVAIEKAFLNEVELASSIDPKAQLEFLRRLIGSGGSLAS